MSTKKEKAPVKISLEKQAPKEATAAKPVTPPGEPSKQVLGQLSNPVSRQQALSPRAYLMADPEAIQAAATEVPWGFGSALAAKLKGRDWVMPCGAGVTPDLMKLCITVPADAVVEGAEALDLPDALVEAARFKAEAEHRNPDREAHVTIATMSRKPGIIHGTWTAWKLDTPKEGTRLDIIGRLFSEVGYKQDILQELPLTENPF